jgi:hypothetical protein
VPEGLELVEGLLYAFEFLVLIEPGVLLGLGLTVA